jgi:hypothetical protein
MGPGLEVERAEQGGEHRRVASPRRRGDDHPPDVDDPVTRFDRDPAGQLGGQRPGWQDDPSATRRRTVAPAEDVHRTRVELVLLAVVGLAISPAVLAHRGSAQLVDGRQVRIAGHDGEAHLRAGGQRHRQAVEGIGIGTRAARRGHHRPHSTSATG